MHQRPGETEVVSPVQLCRLKEMKLRLENARSPKGYLLAEERAMPGIRIGREKTCKENVCRGYCIRSCINAIKDATRVVCYAWSSVTIELCKELIELGPVLCGGCELFVLSGDNVLRDC